MQRSFFSFFSFFGAAGIFRRSGLTGEAFAVTPGSVLVRDGEAM